MELAEKLWENVSKLDALIAMFEDTYLELAEMGTGRIEDRERSSWAFYLMKDIVGETLKQVNELYANEAVKNALSNGGMENG